MKELIKEIESNLGNDIFKKMWEVIYGDVDSYDEISVLSIKKFDALNLKGVVEIRFENIIYVVDWEYGNSCGSVIRDIDKRVKCKNLVLSKVNFNWHPTSDGEEMGEDWSWFELGVKGVIEMYEEDSGVVVIFENGDKEKVFNLNRVFYKNQ